MRYKPERALTRGQFKYHSDNTETQVEMRYKPERALTQFSRRRSSIALRFVEMRYKPESKVLVFVTRKMIKEWCERQVPRKVLGDSHLKNLDNWLKKIGRYANIHL